MGGQAAGQSPGVVGEPGGGVGANPAFFLAFSGQQEEETVCGWTAGLGTLLSKQEFGGSPVSWSVDIVSPQTTL